MRTETRTVSGYAGLHRFQPMQIVRCASVGDVQAAIRRAGREHLHVRPLGLGYSWSPSLVTNDLSISVERLRTVRVDEARRTVVADAGARLGDVTLALAERGLCLPSLPFLADMTIGGAVATASHGTSPHAGTISDFVRSIDIVTASGELRRFGPERDSDETRAASVSVGMLGVIVRVELDAVQIPWVRRRTIETDLATLAGRLDELLEEHAHVWVHWKLGAERVEALCLERRSRASDGFHPYVEGRNARWNPPVRRFGRVLPAGVARIARLVGAKRRSDPDAFGLRPFASDPHAALRVSMQYGLPRPQAAQAIDLIAGSRFAAQNPDQVLEMKFLKRSDRSFIGPNSGHDAVLFNAYWSVAPGRRFSALRSFEEMMRGLHARPHWGKLHRPVDLPTMERAFPEWPRFDRVRRSLDPRHMFSVFAEELAPEDARASWGPDHDQRAGGDEISAVPAPAGWQVEP